MKTPQCPICATGELEFFSAMDEIHYKEQTLSVEVEYAVCRQCGEEMILPDQIKRNDCRTRDAWRKADGLLTGNEIVALRKQLELTQQEASQRFGGGQNAFSKYERGEVIQSAAMDKLMRLALEKQPVDVPRWLSGRAAHDNQTPSSGYGNIIPFETKSKNAAIPSDVIQSFDEINYG